MQRDPSAERPLIIFRSELNLIVREAARWPDRETGGDLFGYWTHSGSPVVHYALGPGPNSRHEHASFYQDSRFLQREGVRLNDRFGLQHLGEWHSHHRIRLDHPSGGDIDTVAGALRRYGFDRFALVICTLDGDGRGRGPENVGLNGFLFESASYGADYVRCPWVELPGFSPVRLQLVGEGEEYATSPHGRDGKRARSATYDLRREVTTMAELRGGPRVRPVEGSAWYVAPAGQDLLRRELADLEALCGARPRVVLNDSDEVVIEAVHAHGRFRYRLPADFPRGVPAVERTPEAPWERPTPWDGSLAALHRRLTEERQPTPREPENLLSEESLSSPTRDTP